MRFTLSSLIVCISLSTTYGQSMSDRRLEAERLLRDRKYDEACAAFMSLAKHAGSNSSGTAYDCTKALNLLRKLDRVSELDGFRKSVATVHAKNYHVLEVLANDYATDPHHWGYTVNGRFFRGSVRFGNAKPVTCFARDRAVAIRLMYTAAIQRKTSSKKEYGRLCLATARLILYEEGVRRPEVLETLTDLEKQLAFEPGHSARYRIGGGEDSEFVLERFDFPAVPVSWKASSTDGERWRFLLSESKANGFEKEASLEWADYLHQVLGVRQLRHVGYVAPEVLAEACLNLSDEESLTVLDGMVSKIRLANEVNYIKIFTKYKALKRLAKVYSDRGQWKRLSALRQLPEVNETLVKGYSFESTSPSPLFLTSMILYYKEAAKVSVNVSTIDMVAIWNDMIAYLDSNPSFLSSQRLSLSNLATRARENRDLFLTTYASRKDFSLPAIDFDGLGMVDMASMLDDDGLYLVEGKTDRGFSFGTIKHVTNLGILRKNLGTGVWFQVVNLQYGTPLPGKKLHFLGYGSTYENGRFRLTYKTVDRETDANGQVLLSQDDLAGEFGGGYKWAVYCKAEEGMAYMDFESFGVLGVVGHPSNAWRAQLVADRAAYRPGDTLRYHARVVYAGYAEPERLAGKGMAFKMIINNPGKKRIFTVKHRTDETGAFQGSYSIPKNAVEGRYYMYVPGANARIAFDVVTSSSVVPTVTLSSNGRIRPGERASYHLEVSYPRPVSTPVSVEMRTDMMLDEKSYLLNKKTFFELKSDVRTAFVWGRSFTLNTKTLSELKSHLSGAIVVRASVWLGGKRVVRTLRIPIHESPGTIDVTLDRPFYAVGEVVKVRIHAENHAGVPLKGNGTATVVRMVGSGKVSEVAKIPFRTDEMGVALLQMPKFGSGTFKVTATMLPEVAGLCLKIPMMFGGGFHAPASNFLYQHGAYSDKDCLHGHAEIFVHRDGIVDDPYVSVPFRVVPGSRHAREGDKVSVLLLAENSSGEIVLFTRSSLLKVVPVSSRCVMTEFTIKKFGLPSTFIEGVMVNQKGVCSETVEISLAAPQRDLSMEIQGPDAAASGAVVKIPVMVKNAEEGTCLMAKVVEGSWSLAEGPIPLRPRRSTYEAKTESSFVASYRRPEIPQFLSDPTTRLLAEEDGTITEDSGVAMPLIDRFQMPATRYFGELKIDASGRGQLLVEMPQSGRDMRVFMWAIGKNGAFGWVEKTIVNKTSGSLDIKGPDSLQVGETAYAQVAFSNGLRQAQVENMEVSASTALAVQGKALQKLSCPAGQEVKTDVVIKGLRAGEGVLSVSARGALGRLTVDHHLTVVESKKVRGRASHFSITLDETFKSVDLPKQATELVWAFGIAGVLQLAMEEPRLECELPLESLNQLLVPAHALAVRRDGVKKDGEPPDQRKEALHEKAKEVMLLIAETQCGDGGWNWIGNSGACGEAETTAWIVHGLQRARNRGLEIPRNVLFRGIQFLRGYMAEQVIRLNAVPGGTFQPKAVCDDMDALVYMVLLESRDRPKQILDFLIRDSKKLSLVARCRLVQALRIQRYYEKIPALMEDLYGLCNKDATGTRAWIGNNLVLGTVEFLIAMNVASPGDPELMPYVDWLMDQRVTTGSWGGGRLDSRCMDALASYAKARENSACGVISVKVGKEIRNYDYPSTADLVRAKGRYSLNTLETEVLTQGSGRLYLSVSMPSETADTGIETGIELVLRKDEPLAVGKVVRAVVTLNSERDLSSVQLRLPLPGGLRPLVAGKSLGDTASFQQGIFRDGCAHFYAKRLKAGLVELPMTLQVYARGTFRLTAPEVYVDGFGMVQEKKGERDIVVGR